MPQNEEEEEIIWQKLFFKLLKKWKLIENLWGNSQKAELTLKRKKKLHEGNQRLSSTWAQRWQKGQVFQLKASLKALTLFSLILRVELNTALITIRWENYNLNKAGISLTNSEGFSPEEASEEASFHKQLSLIPRMI